MKITKKFIIITKNKKCLSFLCILTKPKSVTLVIK